jgi:hypothetical protein
MTEVALEDQKVALPVVKFWSIAHKIKMLRYPVTGGKHAVSRLPRSARAAFAARLRQITVKTKPVILLAVDEAVDRFSTDADQADAVGQQTASDLFRRPVGFQPLDHHATKMRMAPEFPQTPAALLGDVIGNGTIRAVVVRKLMIANRITPYLAIDRRPVTTELARHLIDRHLPFNQTVEATTIGEAVASLTGPTVVLLNSRVLVPA